MFQTKASRTPQDGTESALGAGSVDIERRSGRLRRARLTFVVSIALAAMLMAAIPMPAAATSYFGSNGKGFTTFECHSAARQIVVTVHMFATAYPQSMGRDLYVPSAGRWKLLSSFWDTPDGTVLPIQTTVNISASAGWNTFKVDYYWYTTAGWRYGTPGAERFDIWC